MNLIKLLYKAAERTINHDGVEHAGYMSFMVLLAMFPFVVFFLALTSFFGASEIGQNFVAFMMDSLPNNTTEIVKYRFREISSSPPQGLMTIAIAGAIWTSSSFVEGLRTILNRVYEISSPPTYWYRRVLSILQFFLITISISFIMFLFVVLPITMRKFPELYKLIVELGETMPLLAESRYVFIYGGLFFTISALYYIIPNVKLKFTEVLPGSVLTLLLWIGSGNILSKYLTHYYQTSVVYGSLGSIILTLVFFYVISMLFIYGAEVNYLLGRRKHKHMIDG